MSVDSFWRGIGFVGAEFWKDRVKGDLCRVGEG